MGKNNNPSLPATPTYQTDPIFNSGYQDLSKYANQLISGNYSGLGGIGDAVSLHPQSTQLALQSAQGFLQPQYAQSNLDIQNQAIANNQNTSSTFTDALAKNANTLNSQYQGIATNAALQDAQTARQNQIGLLGTGLNTLQSSTNFGLQNQQDENQFNLENYSNQVAQALSSQKQQNGGFLGALTGAAGGALGGSSFGPIGAIAGGIGGGLSGGLSPQSSNLGGNILQAGSGLYGSNQQNQTLQNIFSSGASAPTPGFYASNYSLNSSNPQLAGFFSGGL